jgi:hypothetical protein
MEAWIDFVVVGFVALAFFVACALYEKRFSDAPHLLLFGVLAGTPLGLVSDFALWGAYTYPLGYGLFYLTLNAAVVYGLFVATVLVLQRTRLLRFFIWITALMAVYEITNYFFTVWTYEVTPFLCWLSFVLVGYFATAIFVALIGHLFFGYKFEFIDNLKRHPL